MSEAMEQAVVEKTVVLPGQDKRVWAERVINDILRLMECPATLDFKDAEDGSLSIALMFEKDLPGVAKGKRSFFMDSLQLLLNKIVNPPGIERRWVNLGAFEHPLPRGQKKPAVVAPPAAAVVVPAAPVEATKPLKNGKAATKTAATAPVAVKEKAVDETTLKVSADKALSAQAKALLEKSAHFGRYYAVFAMASEDRARMVQAGAKAKGVKVAAEGEGRMRRVVWTPESPKPMPKQMLPDYDDEEGDEE